MRKKYQVGFPYRFDDEEFLLNSLVIAAETPAEAIRLYHDHWRIIPGICDGLGAGFWRDGWEAQFPEDVIFTGNVREFFAEKPEFGEIYLSHCLVEKEQERESTATEVPIEMRKFVYNKLLIEWGAPEAHEHIGPLRAYPEFTCEVCQQINIMTEGEPTLDWICAECMKNQQAAN